MKIKMNVAAMGRDDDAAMSDVRRYEAGRVYDVGPDLARSFVDAGLAREIIEPSTMEIKMEPTALENKMADAPEENKRRGRPRK